MNDKDMEFNNDLSLVWSWCAEALSPGFVAICQWTGFSLNQYFASGSLNSFVDISFPKLLLEVLWHRFLIAPQPQCECSVKTERSRNKGWGRQKKYQLGSWSFWRITVSPGELRAARSLSVRQLQPVLSLGSAQGNFSQRHQPTAGRKAGMGILQIQASRVVAKAEKPHLFDSETRGTANLYRHSVQTLVDTWVVHGTLVLAQAPLKRRVTQHGHKIILDSAAEKSNQT